MFDFNEKCIFDEKNRPVAVQPDIAVFRKVEKIVEDHGLVLAMNETEGETKLQRREANAFYRVLTK